MKPKAIIIAVLALGLTSVAMSQTMQVTSYVENTHVSPKLGTAITYLFPGMIEAGAFYQQSATPIEQEYGRPLREEREFLGAYMAYPFFIGDKWNVKLNVRTGISNKENFVITPAVQGTYALFRQIKIMAGVGTRNFRPTLMAGFKLTL
jgi:hypothetical protein